MSVPTYAARKNLEALVNQDIPTSLGELWGALESAWEDIEELEGEVDKLNAEITELENA